ncbi:MAG TPA: hypothetical protein PLV66_02140, partial [Thermoanaerobaculales bacterium]|nr:hypothetical protein [Thermoanaerobaculales bacterium]
LPPPELGGSAGSLFRINRGQILGMLQRDAAERGYHLYQDRRVMKIVWRGDYVEAALIQPECTVKIPAPEPDGPLQSLCTVCGGPEPCHHTAAALMQWLDIRPTMHRLGPGSAWRAKSRHPFIAPSRIAAERVDLSHLTGADLRSALELQLSLQSSGTASARLVGSTVEIHIRLPSGDTRVVFFSATVLPAALPLLRSLPRIRLEGELDGLELSEARLRPVLASQWTDQGIVLEPAYRLADGNLLPAAKLDGRIHGRWARIGNLLCRVLDPATPLVPFHRKGRQTLAGEEAQRFQPRPSPAQPTRVVSPSGAARDLPRPGAPEAGEPGGGADPERDHPDPGPLSCGGDRPRLGPGARDRRRGVRTRRRLHRARPRPAPDHAHRLPVPEVPRRQGPARQPVELHPAGRGVRAAGRRR